MSFAWRGSDRGMKGLSMQTLSTVALGGLALIFAIVSLLGFLAPGILLDPLGIIFDSPAGAAEMRSVYGGFFGTGAILFGLGSAREGLRRMALIGATMLLFAFSLGRLLRGILDGVPGGGPSLVNTIVEALGFLFFLALLQGTSRSTARFASEEK